MTAIAAAPDTGKDGVADLTRLAPGDRMREPLLVHAIERRAAGEQSFTVVEFRNRTGILPSAPFWGEERDRLGGLRRGDIVLVTGEVTTYRDRRQLRVLSLKPLPTEGVDWRVFLPSVPAEPCWRLLDHWRSRMGADRLRPVLDLFFEDAGFRREFEECPASLAGHHACLGGLLHHTREVAAIGMAIAETCGADRDLVLAGALLHDIGKLQSYRWRGGFTMTDQGALLGHVVLGALELDARIRQATPAPCTSQQRDLLLHLVLSHHGKLEFGSPVLPMTLESEILHHADDASARSNSMAQALDDPENFLPGESVSHRPIWQLDRRRVYRVAVSQGDE